MAAAEPTRRAASGTAAPLVATLCGDFTVRAGQSVLVSRQMGGAKPRHLLIALLRSPGQPVDKHRLVELLWGVCPPPGAVATLESYVSFLRRKLDGLEAGEGTLIKTVPGGYVVDPDRVAVDTHQFGRLAREARDPAVSPTRAVAAFAAALSVVEGAFLPEENGIGWIDEERQAHQQRVTRVLVDAAAAALLAGDLDLSERWARSGLERDPFDEGAWRALLESMERRGRHADALRAYDTCRRLFADELGCVPGPGLQHTFARLLAGTQHGRDEGLDHLLQAVVRLHLEVVAAPSGGSRDAAGWQPPAPAALEEACSLLDRLLVRVRSDARSGVSALA